MIEQLKTLDLFCGAGGASLGLWRHNNIDLIAGIDNNETALEVYRDNFEDHKAICHDLSDVDIDVLQDVEIDYVHGSPPCKGFSQAGKRDENDTRNNLVLKFCEWVNRIEPEYVTMENVTGMKSMNLPNGENVTDAVEQKLSDYTIMWTELNAKNFGTPQERKRLVMFASKNSAVKTPKITHSDMQQETIQGCVLPDCRGLDTIVDDAHSQIPATSYTWHIEGERDNRSTEKPAYTCTAYNPTYVVTDDWNPQYESIRDAPVRKLTVKEHAQVQDFPSDWFDCLDSKTDSYQLASNALPAKMMHSIADSVVRTDKN